MLHLGLPVSASFDDDLRRIFNHDLRLPLVLHNQPAHTDILAVIECLGWLIELAPIFPPNHDGEKVIGIGLVQIEEGRLARDLLSTF